MAPFIIALLLLLQTGCSWLYDSTADVELQIDKRAKAICNPKWGDLKGVLYRDLSYQTHTRKSTKKGKGASSFKRSLDALPDGRISFPTKVHSVDEGTEGIRAFGTMRLRIRCGAGHTRCHRAVLGHGA
ncbi:MAG TPA: hypothetical protein DCR55_08345 [Lentisphaeria bacterium]|nr:hypothetical protein [Lentisphaeria bacterium]